MSTLIKTSVEVLLLLFAIGGLQALLRGLGIVGYGVSIHNMHVVNAVRPLIQKIPDHQVSILPP